MIIDMDTHIMPKDIYDYIEGPLADKKPVYEFDKEGRMVGWKFPGWHQVEGTTPLRPPGSGSNYKGTFEIETRLDTVLGAQQLQAMGDFQLGVARLPDPPIQPLALVQQTGLGL